MKFCRISFLCLVAMVSFAMAEDELISTNIYSVIAPEIIRPHSTYDIILQSDKANETIHFEISFASLTDNSKSNALLETFKRTVKLAPNTKQKVSILIEDLPADKYSLNVKVTIGNQKPTSHVNNLKYPTGNTNILLQTDKGLYKPGDKLQFRIVILDKNNLPKSNQNFSAYLTDPNRNRLKQWANQTLDAYGHFQDSFDFSQNIELGNYELTVEIENQKRTLSVELKEYILPLFSVDITVPKVVSFEQPEVPVVIVSKYTHGKNVKGTVNITLQSHGCLSNGCDYYTSKYWPESVPLKQTSIQLPINGKVETVFDPVKQLNIRTLEQNSEFEVVALVTETVTGKNYTQSTTFTLKTKTADLVLAETDKRLKPGLKYFGLIQGSSFDGKPIDDSTNPVLIGYRFSEQDDFVSMEKFLKNGNIAFNLDVPLNATFLYVRASYKKYRYNLGEFYSDRSSNDNEMQMLPWEETKLTNNKVKLIPASNSNDMTKVKTVIQTAKPIDRFNWAVVANDEVVQHELVNTESKSKHEIEFDFLPSMQNGFQVFAYFLPVNSSKWLFTQASYVSSISQLSNLKINSSIQTGKPGDEPIISVEGLPNTFVALLGVDKSNILLKKPTLIDEDQLKSQNQINSNSFLRAFSYSYYQTSGFKNAKIHFITNIQNQDSRIYYSYNSMARGVPMSAAAVPKSLMAVESFAADRSFDNSLPDLKVRKDFPETWIWADAIIDPITKKATFKPKIPDSITTWVLNAFGVNTKTGLSVAHTPYELTVFNKFFIKANLPYSVVRDEIVTINVLVYNYLGKHKSVQVTLHNELGEFLFVKTASELISGDNEVDHEEDQARQTRSVQVGNDEVASVSFLVRAKQVGHIKLQMVGQTEDGLAGDKVEQLLLVKPEGEVQRFNKALLISLKQSDSSKEFVERVPISIPLDVVPSSSLITVDAIADVLGTRLSNLDNLVRMPYGCGEQNMAGLVPNIVALNYLTKTNQLTETIKNKVIKNLESGYVRQLKYQHHDGGFSAFGESSYSKNASTWLSAYVVNWFAAASKIITIDEKILDRTVNFLLQNIDKEGHAVESGKLFDKHMSGGVVGNSNVQTSPALDAFVLMALNQAKSIGLVNESNLTATIQALESFVTEFKKADENDKSRDRDFYTLAIVSAALNQVGSSKASQAFEHLWTLRQTDASLRLFFDNPKRNETVTKSENLYYAYLSQPNSNSVEATAYALSVLTSRNDVENGLRIIQWLISKQNSNGGWSSTQDTVVAMNALAQFAASTYEPNTNLNVVFASKSQSSEEGKPAFQGSFDLNKSNSLVLQKSEWNERGFESEYKQLKEIEVKGKGAGTAVVQVSWQYNVVKKDENNVFAITHKVNQPSASSFVLEVCAKYSEEGETNMAIVSVETPSGFEYDLFEVNNLRQSNQQIQRIDVNSQNNQASFYFNSINKEGVCFNVTLNRVNCVYNLKPALINVYDYYQTTKASRYFYEIPIKTAC